MGLTIGKGEAVKEDVKGAPVDPVKPKAAVKAAADDVAKDAAKTPSGTAAKAAADDVAKGTVKPTDTTTKPPEAPKSAEVQKPGEEELPDNQWTRYYYDLKAQVDSNPAMQGPLANMALAILLMAAKYSHYFDLMPGKFIARLSEDDDLKDKKFDKVADKDKIDKIVRAKGTDALALAALKTLQDADKLAGKKTGIEKASTRYVTNALWGVDGIDDAASLAANLLHTKKTPGGGDDVGLYNLGTLDAVKAQPIIPKGTILIFVPNMKRGHKIVAYATGVADGFAYYDIEKEGGKVVTFNLRSADSPVKSELGLMAVLVPNTAAYAAAMDAPPEKPAEPVKPVDAEAGRKASQEAADRAVAAIEKGNQETKLLIDEYKMNPNPRNLPILLQVAEEKEKAAQEAYDKVKSNFEGLDKKLTDARAAEASAKVKSEAAEATEADKKAYEEAQKKTAEIKAIKDYQSKFETILGTAKTNAAEAKKLANV